MAYITFQNKKEQIHEQAAVASFLSSQEVIYENWDISKLPPSLVEKYLLSDEEKKKSLILLQEK